MMRQILVDMAIVTRQSSKADVCRHGETGRHGHHSSNLNNPGSRQRLENTATKLVRFDMPRPGIPVSMTRQRPGMRLISLPARIHTQSQPARAASLAIIMAVTGRLGHWNPLPRNIVCSSWLLLQASGHISLPQSKVQAGKQLSTSHIHSNVATT